MALLAVVRRLRVRTSSPNFYFYKFSNLFPDQPAIPRATVCLNRAFHRIPCRPCGGTPKFGILPQAHDQIIYQIINFEECIEEGGGDVPLDLGEFLERVQKAKDFASGDEALAFLDDSGIKPDKDFIVSVIWGLREEWKLAYLVFKWGEKWDCVVERTWCLMIWLLGNHKKFSSGWSLIHELFHASKDTQQAMLIMIDRYAAANHPDKAIKTFNLMQNFKFAPDQKTYFTFLGILCRHGNVEEAEEFMFINKKIFPLEVESFNIILNAWCNIAKDIYEAKRVWREMSSCCIEPDGTSYTHMISCYSTVGNLFDSLRLYDQMKKRGFIPGVDVYHSLIYVLSCENCVDEALKIVDRMKETGLEPNSTTYNLVIRPLCQSRKFEEARTILSRMIEDEIDPTVETYHSLILGEGLEGTMGVLDRMKRARLGPNKSTFVVVLDGFFELGQGENALKIWSKIERYEVKPDETLYGVLVKGLVKFGRISEAKKFYSEMTSIGLADDPSIKKLLEQRVQKRKDKRRMSVVRRVKTGKGLRCSSSRVSRKDPRHLMGKKRANRS